MYVITEYTRKQAKKLGVTVKPSKNKKKKIDVYRGSRRVASVGAVGYSDYPTFIKRKGLPYANRRRQLYRMRHERDMYNKGSNGYYAANLLW